MMERGDRDDRRGPPGWVRVRVEVACYGSSDKRMAHAARGVSRLSTREALFSLGMPCAAFRLSAPKATERHLSLRQSRIGA